MNILTLTRIASKYLSKDIRECGHDVKKMFFFAAYMITKFNANCQTPKCEKTLQM